MLIISLCVKMIVQCFVEIRQHNKKEVGYWKKVYFLLSMVLHSQLPVNSTYVKS